MSQSEIVYEPHARDRMRERGVSERDVEQTLAKPDRTRPALPQRVPCQIYERRIDDRICKVYIRISQVPLTVATVAWHND